MYTYNCFNIVPQFDRWSDRMTEIPYQYLKKTLSQEAKATANRSHVGIPVGQRVGDADVGHRIFSFPASTPCHAVEET